MLSVHSAKRCSPCVGRAHSQLGGSCAGTNHSQMWWAAADGCGKKNGQAKNGTNGPMQSMSANSCNKGWKQIWCRPTCDIGASKSWGFLVFCLSPSSKEQNTYTCVRVVHRGALKCSCTLLRGASMQHPSKNKSLDKKWEAMMTALVCNFVRQAQQRTHCRPCSKKGHCRINRPYRIHLGY